MGNIDTKTVASFGDEWSRFDQSGMSNEEAIKAFNEYFAIFPWEQLPHDATGFDMGCGSGRWANFVAPKVGHLNCVDPSIAIEVAQKKLGAHSNISYHNTSVSDSGLKKESQDFGYSLGVLHHVPDTQAAIHSCVELLKPGSPLLLYLYYALDNKPWWYKAIWKTSDLARKLIYRLPPTIKHLVTDSVALLVYFPLARLSRILERMGMRVDNIPLAHYRTHTFYTMRTDSRDRLGTPLESRFTKKQIFEMMQSAGLEDIEFSPNPPFWCAVGRKKI